MSYITEHNLDPVVRGDTLITPIFEFDFDGSGHEISEAWFQLRNARGIAVTTPELLVSSSTTVDSTSIVTSNISAGEYTYGILVKLNTNVIRTYVSGKINILNASVTGINCGDLV